MHSKIICSICLDDMTKDSSIVSLPCGHIFGRSCLDECVRSSQKCPLCMVKFRTKDIRRLYFDLEDDDICIKETSDQFAEKTATLTQQCISLSKICKTITDNPQVLQQINKIVDEVKAIGGNGTKAAPDNTTASQSDQGINTKVAKIRYLAFKNLLFRSGPRA